MPADHMTAEVPGASLHVEVVGKGAPLLLMHGGPGGSLYTMAPFGALADEFTVVLYDTTRSRSSWRGASSTAASSHAR